LKFYVPLLNEEIEKLGDSRKDNKRNILEVMKEETKYLSQLVRILFLILILKKMV